MVWTFGGLTVTLDLDFRVLSVAQEVSSPWESLASSSQGN